MIPELNHQEESSADKKSAFYLPFVPIIGFVFLGLLNLWDFTPIQRYIADNFGSNDPLFLVKRQLMWIGAGLLVFGFVWRFYEHLFKVRWLAVILLPMMQAMTFWPDLGVRLYGSNRHIQLFGVSVYISIWVVLLAAVALSTWLMWLKKAQRTWLVAGGLFVWLILINSLLIKQGDLPMFVLLNVMALGMAVMSRGEKKIPVTVVSMVVLIMLVFFAVFVLNQEYRRDRFMAAYDYQIDPFGDGYQTRIALEDIQSGGWIGQGLGSFKNEGDASSVHHLLPQTVTTNMIQITGRNQGILGIGLVIVLWGGFLVFCWGKVKAAQQDFDHQVKLGVMLFLGGQAFFSIVRTINLIPFMPSHAIPFFSYGSATTLAAFAAMGLLFGGASQGSLLKTQAVKKP